MVSTLTRIIRFIHGYRTIALLALIAIVAGTVAELYAPQVLRTLIDDGIIGGDRDQIWRSAGWLTALAVFSGLARFAYGYLSARVSHGAAFGLRKEIFAKLQKLSFSYYDRVQTGQLMTRVTSDVDLVRDFIGGGMVQMISAVLMLVITAAILLSMNLWLALIALSVIPVTLLILLLFVSRLGPMFKSFQERLSRLNGIFGENISGVRIVRTFTAEDSETDRYRRANQDLLDSGLAIRNSIANAFPLLFSVGSFGVVLITWVGAVMIVKRTLSVGELVAFTSYLVLLLQPLFMLGFGAQQIARASAGAERIFEILDAKIDVAEVDDAIVLPEVQGRITFEDVTLQYPGDARDILKGLTFSIETKTTVAVVGSTGSGKTSLVNLIPRYYDPSEGVVAIDGHDVRTLKLDFLRRHIAMVMQDPVLFSGTVSENISYGRPEATQDQIEAVARMAQAHGFISALSKGYMTHIGERGVTLSGGQRQRISIARALLVDPKILIMDDSTSALDSRTESALIEDLDDLMRTRTTIIIGQRPSALARADKVLLIEDGRIADEGTHQELLERNCTYAEILATPPGAVPHELPSFCDMSGLEGRDA